VEQARAFGRLTVGRLRSAWWLADGLAAGGWLAELLGKRPRLGPFHDRGQKRFKYGLNWP
jgi:hypothetical protein